MSRLSEMNLQDLIASGGFDCPCGIRHKTDLQYLRLGKNVVCYTAEGIRALGASRPFLVCDENTMAAVGNQVQRILRENNIPFSVYCFPTRERLMPAEKELGSIMMHYDSNCDLILAIGSGVINDLCKMTARMTGHPSMLICTAPSMDGIVSNSAAMEVNHVKTTIYTPAPKAVICDTKIMSQAPFRMLQAGVGDMAAKMVSICDWRISSLINEEYYCEEIADMMRTAWKKVSANIDGISDRDPDAVEKVTEGLILSGIAMAFAGVSRPASGLEHTFSHIWEMMALERNRSYDLHGIQVGIGTLAALRVYDYLRELIPDEAHLNSAITAYSQDAWEKDLNRVFDSAAPALIALESKAKKNAPEGRRARSDRIRTHWSEIQKIIYEEIIDPEEVRCVFQKISFPSKLRDIGISYQDALDALLYSKDIRSRYLSTSMIWDLGYTEEMVASFQNWN